MPKYLVTSGSHFDPFTYDELVKPIERVQAVHDATQEAYDKMSLDTNALAQYITNNPEDSKAKELYDSYISQIDVLQNNLMSYGVTAKTKRDLSAARNSYAKDIVRIQNAVKNRQERSKEYWDYKHKNPDAVMGADPGASGLNSYLDDTEFGKNYFAYSGEAFTNEVGADAKARVDELLHDPEIMKNPQLAGYITRITKEGFSSEEVANAGNAVQAVLNGQLPESALGELTASEQILADVLMSHVVSTGAKDKVSPSEFNRLIQYGRAGLAQSIGKTKIDDLNDKQWEQNASWNMWKRQQNYRNPKPTSGGPVTLTNAPYTLNDISTYMEAANAKRINETLGDKFYKPFEQPIIVKDDSGAAQVISSPFDAERLLNSFGRDAIMNTYGIDPDAPVGKWTLTDGNGGTEQIRVSQYVSGSPDVDDDTRKLGLKTYDYVIKRKNDKDDWVVDVEATKDFNADRKEYKEKRSAWEKENKDINLRKLAISPKDRQKIYDKYNIPEDVAFEDIPYILETMSKQGRVTPATIAGSTEDMEKTRLNYANQIISSFGRIAGQKGKVSKTSEAAFYPVDGFNIAETGETDIKDVFGTTDTNGRFINEKALSEVTVLPDDLANDKVRITVNGKQYAINPAMLGNDVDYQVQRMKEPVLYMMLPILDPSTAMRMSPQEQANWVYTTSQFLGDYMRLVDRNEDGSIGAISPRDIVMHPELQGMLRNAVTRFMNNVLADPRDNMMLNNYQVRGNTSTKASGYNDYIGK